MGLAFFRKIGYTFNRAVLSNVLDVRLADLFRISEILRTRSFFISLDKSVEIGYTDYRRRTDGWSLPVIFAFYTSDSRFCVFVLKGEAPFFA